MSIQKVHAYARIAILSAMILRIRTVIAIAACTVETRKQVAGWRQGTTRGCRLEVTAIVFAEVVDAA